MFDQLCTFLAFIIAVGLTPGLVLCYIIMRACRNAWLYILSSVHPDVDFIRDMTVRTLVDTRRNQGIFTVLLRVEGEPQVDLVRRHLQEVVTRADKLGRARFPKLSMLLVSRWGSYAWKKTPPGKEFTVDQVLVVGGRSTHRGRPLTELNVREHVSDIVTRYLPRGVPPWQLVVLPCNGSDCHYLLLRMHHLLLTDGDINIADLLPLAASPEPGADSIRHHMWSPLENVLERPDQVYLLHQTLTENLTNRWNEFTSYHDPLNRPELLKTTQKLSGFTATLMVTVVAIFRKLWLGYGNISPDISSRFKYAKACIRHELASRRIDPYSFFLSFLKTIHPWNMVQSFVQTFYWIVIAIVWRLPVQISRELSAIYSRVVHKQNPTNRLIYSKTTVTDLVCNSVPMVYRASAQVFRWLSAIYVAPRLVADELLKSRGWPNGTAIPLCGRKVAAWSTPIEGELLRDINRATGQSCTEVLLTALGDSLTDYYSACGTPAPSEVPVTARRISSSYLFSRGANIRPQDSVSGLLCLRVPTAGGAARAGERLAAVGRSVAAARRAQPCVYAMSVLQTKHRMVTRALPSVLVAVLLKYLSQKYTVSVTELVAGDGVEEARHTTWGKTVTDIIYWRPPQANISVSLCLNYYGDMVTLAVMADALLSPHHMPIADGLPVHVEALAKAVGL